ncbi:MAG: Pre-mRNA-splicing factor slt11 [Watsoniomyces obsoletus]|nr:MAG: Pre-mRNA-splicing factor slt11 [Watsoniomyces obsoletus]
MTVTPTDSTLLSEDPFQALLGIDESLTPADRSVSPAELMDMGEDLDSQTTATRATSQCPTEGDKKPTKKRKSWGQELPTPKTNLPPRKRAKTEDEKEQRRIERVLRNRAAAQSSRERKRKEVEGLEEEKEQIRRQNALLTAQLQQVERENQELSRRVAKMAAEMTVFRNMMQGKGLPSPCAPATGTTRQVSPTLSADLLPHVDSIPHLKQELADFDFTLPPPQSTVDPRGGSLSSASGSPPPSVDADADADVIPTVLTIPDSTQHPAVVLCDLPCQSEWSETTWEHQRQQANQQQQPGEASSLPTSTTSPALANFTILFTASHLLLATLVSAVSSHLTQPLAEIFHSLRTGCPISTAATTNSIEILLPLIHWLVSTPTNPLSTSSSTMKTSSSHHHQPSPQTTPASNKNSTPHYNPSPSSLPPTFRTSLLRRLLACSPALARPLRDATGRALRRRMSSDELILDGRFGANEAEGKLSLYEQQMMTRTEVDSLRAMLSVLDSVVCEQESQLPFNGLNGRGIGSQNDDPSSEVQRLCATLDEIFPGPRRGSIDKMTKIFGLGWG